MSLTTEGMSAADLAAITGNNNGGWGNDGFMWLIVLFLFAFAGGWGGNGGFIGGGNSGAAEGYVLTSDFAQVERKLDSITNGLCDGFYTQAQLVNGVQQGLAQQGYETRNAIQADTIAGMQGFNTLQAQLAQCCCDYKAGMADLGYNIATSTCAINTANANNTRDILDNQNQNARAILDALAQQRTETLKERIAEQDQKIQALQLRESQEAQNNYLVSALRPCPIPAYNVPNPYQYSGCGCQCGF